MTFLAIGIALIVVTLAGEARRSSQNERRLRAAGAREPDDDVWRPMAVVYPLAFVAMVVEGMWRGGPGAAPFAIGLAIWTAAKLLKYWAIASLGSRWSFRVLVMPDAPLVAKGPYRWLRHPNYVAVGGELAGVATMMAAPVTGVLFSLAFAEILRRRILVEERALGMRG